MPAFDAARPLTTLPNGVLTAICQLIDAKGDLLRLRYTCTLLQHLAEPHLYFATAITDEPLPHALHTALVQKPQRRRWVQQCVVRYTKDYTEEFRNQAMWYPSVAETLRSLVNLKSLDLTGPHWCDDFDSSDDEVAEDEENSREYCPPEQLELTELFGDNSIGDEKEVTYSFRRLQRLVLHYGQFPSRSSLCIQRIRENETLHLKTRLERLELLDCHIQVSVFQCMLLRPRALKVLVLEQCPPRRLERDDRPAETEDQYFDVIRQQKRSLERVEILVAFCVTRPSGDYRRFAKEQLGGWPKLRTLVLGKDAEREEYAWQVQGWELQENLT